MKRPQVYLEEFHENAQTINPACAGLAWLFSHEIKDNNSFTIN